MKTSTTTQWFSELGFDVWQVPGISRAWRREFQDGSYLLITDLGGYDLPAAGGPYAGLLLSSIDELIECQGWLRNSKELFAWFRHTNRLSNSRRDSGSSPLNENSESRVSHLE